MLLDTFVTRCAIATEPTPLEIARKAVDLKILDPAELDRCLAETRSASGAAERSLVDVLLEKGALHVDEVDYLRASLSKDDYPTVIAGFQLLERIGQGAMGVVYKARQMSMEREVALKILSPRLARNNRYVARFQREARAVARLNHPNIVAGIDVGVDQGYYYFAMELVEGRTVQQMLDENGPLPERRALEIARDVAMAIAHAWDRGLIHRDIKPGNVVVTYDGIVKMADLGLAKYAEDEAVPLTDTGITPGTAWYVSPEQARGEKALDARSDIYSLGATLFHMLAGRPPYLGSSVSVMTQHMTGPLPDVRSLRSGLSEGVAAVLRMMMARDRRERYRLPEELVTDIRRLLAGRPPLLARTDAQGAVLTDAADYEEEVLPEVSTADRLRHLKEEIGWIARRGRLGFLLKVGIVALVWLAFTAGLLYILGLLR